MGLIEDELEIVNLDKLLNMDLEIPVYQRPYNWSPKSVNTLFTDIYGAYKNKIPEYRIGSVILHKNIEDKFNVVYNIVDGQQRITTIAILLFCIDKKIDFLKKKFSILSEKGITDNYQILRRRVSEIENDKDFQKYLLKKCTMVKIVTNQEQQAFQFFDSQNTRGKELAPHDLLKSFHLREMKTDDESMKIKLIEEWESIPQSNLEELFKNYLFPLTQWYRGKNGLGYSSHKISEFKGIKSNNIYNFAIYHKASNLFIEQMAKDGLSELISTKELNQYQLTQPLISGERFFKFTIHYSDLKESIIKKIKNDFEYEEIPMRRSGDLYVKQLFECSLLFFADRFGFEEIDDNVLKFLYDWSYSIRLVMKAVYPQTINKYANGNHKRINENLNIFEKINKMNTPEELSIVTLEMIDKGAYKNDKYKEIWEKIGVSSYG